MTGDGIRGQFHAAPVSAGRCEPEGAASPGQLIYGVTHAFRLVLRPVPSMIARAGSFTDLEGSLSGG